MQKDKSNFFLILTISYTKEAFPLINTNYALKTHVLIDIKEIDAKGDNNNLYFGKSKILNILQAVPINNAR